MVKQWLLAFFILFIAFVGLNSIREANSASNEHLRDGMDRLRDMDITLYCTNVAEYWDDGVWARAMGIEDVILARAPEEPPAYTFEALPRDGVHHHAWGAMNARERDWYAQQFHQGYKDGSEFITSNPQALTENPHDMTGLIPYQIRMAMKEARYKLCLHEGRPRET